ARASPRGTPRAGAPARATCSRGRRSRTYALLWRVSPHGTRPPLRGRPVLAAHAWSFLTQLEAGQVLGDLPRRDLLVVAVPLLPLDADEVVDIVLAPRAAEGLAEDVVPLELRRRLHEV